MYLVLTAIFCSDIVESLKLSSRESALQFGNPLEKGTELNIDLDGFEMGGNKHLVNQTDEHGQINLGGLLTVS